MKRNERRINNKLNYETKKRSEEIIVLIESGSFQQSGYPEHLPPSNLES